LAKYSDSGRVIQSSIFEYDVCSLKAQYPHPQATGTINTADYEQCGYDANGNRTSLRKRDGSELVFAYDALSRVMVRPFFFRPVSTARAEWGCQLVAATSSLRLALSQRSSIPMTGSS